MAVPRKPNSPLSELPHCLDCGTELKKRAVRAGGKRCRVCSNQHKVTDPNYRANHKRAMQVLAQDQDWLAKRREVLSHQREDPIISKRTREALLQLHQDPVWVANQRLVLARVKSDPTYPAKQASGFKKWLKGWSKSRTDIELKVLIALKEGGIKFESQKEIDGYFYDFYLPTSNTLIEVDGCFWHGCAQCGFKGSPTRNDIPKNQLASKLGITLLRLPEHSINGDPDYLKRVIRNIIDPEAKAG